MSRFRRDSRPELSCHVPAPPRSPKKSRVIDPCEMQRFSPRGKGAARGGGDNDPLGILKKNFERIESFENLWILEQNGCLPSDLITWWTWVHSKYVIHIIPLLQQNFIGGQLCPIMGKFLAASLPYGHHHQYQVVSLLLITSLFFYSYWSFHRVLGLPMFL